jgi:hypothetical protein
LTMGRGRYSAPDCAAEVVLFPPAERRLHMPKMLPFLTAVWVRRSLHGHVGSAKSATYRHGIVNEPIVGL